MIKWSAMRGRRLDAYRVFPKAQADYYEEVFDRWVRLFGPPVTFPPEYACVHVFPQSAHARRLAYSLAGDLKSVADRIIDVIPHDRTVSSFKGRIGAGGVMSVYIRGKRYAMQTKQAERRMQEMLLCYAMLGAGAITAEMGARLAENTN